MTATAVVDPMGVTGAATDVAAAGTTPAKPAKTRKPRKPDPEAPKRKALVKSIFSEAAGDEAAAIKRILEISSKEGEDAVRFKVTDFKDAKGESGAPGVKAFYNFRIAWHNARIADLIAARDGKKPVSAEKAKKKVEKINKDLKDLLQELANQGADLKSILGDSGFDAEKLLGLKV